MIVVEVKNFSKRYDETLAVDDISFEINEGEIFGLIGPNGAGKTTTLRVLSTLLQKTNGTVEVIGHDVKDDPDSVRRVISYLPEDAGAYKNLTGRQYLSFISSLYPKAKKGMIEQGVEITDLGERIDDKVDTYSKGMKRRLLIARALMVQPKLAILDEPTSGLDVVNAKQIRDLIKEHAGRGMAILLSSHNMLEVEYLCHRISLINEGQIIESGTPQGLKEKYHAANIEDVFTEVVKE